MENQNETTPLQSDAQTVLAPDPFDDSAWVEQTETTTDVPQETPQEQQSQTTEQKTEEEIFDADEYLKRELGYDNWDAAKNELAELKKLRDTARTPEEVKFANEESKKFFDYAKAGEKTKLYNHLHEQIRLENILSKEVLKSDDAAEIIKLSMQMKNKEGELQPDDIEFLFNQKFAIPEKPEQDLTQTDEDYAVQVARWEKQVEAINKQMIIEAKLAKPELAKYKQELVLPDINKPNNETQQGATPEELAAIRTAYLQSLEGGLKDFNGYNVTALVGNNGEVKLPISYAVTNEEKSAQKAMLENFNMDTYFEKRWLNEDGKSHNSKQLADDIYLLENKDKVFQKIANDAASKALENYLRSKSNINLNGKTGAGTFNPEARTLHQKQVDAIWEA